MRSAPPARRDRGQATVEVALLLPLVAVLLMAVVQVGLVVRTQVLLTEAARAGARAAAVSPHPDEVEAAAESTPGLDPSHLDVRIGPRGAPGTMVEVALDYRSPLVLPLLGRHFDPPRLSARAVMRVE